MTVELYKSKIAICPPVCGDVDLTSDSDMVKVNSIIMLAMMAMVFRAL